MKKITGNGFIFAAGVKKKLNEKHDCLKLLEILGRTKVKSKKGSERKRQLFSQLSVASYADNVSRCREGKGKRLKAGVFSFQLRDKNQPGREADESAPKPAKECRVVKP